MVQRNALLYSVFARRPGRSLGRLLQHIWQHRRHCKFTTTRPEAFLGPRSPKAVEPAIKCGWFLAESNFFQASDAAGIFEKAAQSNRRSMITAKQLPSLESPHRLLQVTKHLGIPPQRKSLRTSTRNFVVQDELDKARRETCAATMCEPSCQPHGSAS